MLPQYEELRNEIRHCKLMEKDCSYIRALSLLNKYLKEIDKLKGVNTKKDRLFIHYEIAIFNKKLCRYNVAIKHALISLNYLEDEEFQGSKYANRLWVLATLYTETGNCKEASKLYHKCSKIFKDINEENQRAMIIFNNAKLLKNFKAMKNIIKIYESKTLTTVVTDYGDMEYYKILKNYFEELIELYMLEGMQDEAFRVIYGIDTNIETLKLLRKELLASLVA